MRFKISTLIGLRSSVFMVLIVLLSSCVPAAVGVIAVTSIDIAKNKRSFGTLIDDNIIEANIFIELANDPKLDDNTHINTVVVNGIALLTGEVSSNEQKLRAAQIANSYQGIDQVVNQLDLLGKTSITSRTNDALITAKVKTELIRSKEVGASNIKVVTERGVVYLLGIVTPEEGASAIAAAKGVGGVVRIVKIFMAPA